MSALLLCGGTGELGRRIAARLAGRGVPFRALVRTGSDGSALEALGVEVVRGDLTDPASLDRALTGVTTVVTTANAMSRMMAGARNLSFEAVDRDGNAELIRAAEAAEVDRFVFLSMAGLSTAMTSRSSFAAAKVATERRLRSSGMRTVIVRPAPFDEVWLGSTTGIDIAKHRATIFGHGRARANFVSSDDVAEACVRLATMDDPPAEIDLGGPEAMSRREAVTAYERATGKKFRRIPVPRVAMAAGNRLLRTRKPAVASVMGMALVMDDEGVEVSPEPMRQLGIEPRSASDYIAETSRAVPAATAGSA
jgi:NADH dehydrogenase